MELVLNSAFSDLTSEDMIMIDGGVNGWAVASGVSWVASGVTGIIAACQE